MRRIQQLNMEFIFQKPSRFNLGIVREFYANFQLDIHTHFVQVQGVEDNLSLLAIDQILGTTKVPSATLMGINTWSPYRDMRHTLAGPHSTARWTCHKYKGYHLYFPFDHMDKEAYVLIKIVVHSLILAYTSQRSHKIETVLYMS